MIQPPWFLFSYNQSVVSSTLIDGIIIMHCISCHRKACLLQLQRIATMPFHCFHGKIHQFVNTFEMNITWFQELPACFYDGLEPDCVSLSSDDACMITTIKSECVVGAYNPPSSTHDSIRPTMGSFCFLLLLLWTWGTCPLSRGPYLYAFADPDQSILQVVLVMELRKRAKRIWKHALLL